MIIDAVSDFILGEKTKKKFSELYGEENEQLSYQQKRYIKLAEEHKKKYSINETRLFSSPGRTEIGGNHTDHNLGKVLASSVPLDCIGAVTPTEDGIISIYDLSYNEEFTVDTASSERIMSEKGSIALVRGVVQGFKNFGYKVGGFKATFTTDVIAAAGVSSSASFEMMLCCILSNLYNGASIPVHKFAQIGQFAENKYWDKSSGLLDQMACAVGGLIRIDFKNPTDPQVKQVHFDFAKQHYNAIIVNTGKGHADLSAEYSSIPHEMKSVAQFFGKQTLRELDITDLLANLPEVRKTCGDRAVMRAFHYFTENEHVDAQCAALEQGDFQAFLKLIRESGTSSWKQLQNTIIPGEAKEQSIPVCLSLTEVFIAEHCANERAGACRIHGGGFAGVIQVFLPQELTEKYRDFMHKALGITDGEKSPVYVLSIRPYGCIELA